MQAPPRAFWLVAAILIVGWLVTAFAVAPWLITAAYNGTSVGFLNGLITGQDQHPLAEYLADGRTLAWMGTLALVAGLGMVLLLLVFRRPLRRLLGELGRTLAGDGAAPGGADVLAILAAAGLLTGALELGVLGIRRTWFAYPGWEYTRHALWMTPLANGLLFVAVAGALLLLPPVRRILSGPVVVLVAATLGLFPLIRFGLPMLHPAAALLLALGLGWRIAMLARGRSARIGGLARRTAAALGAGVLLVGIWSTRGEAWREARVASSLPAARDGAPNVLILMLDTVRSLSLSLYGYEVDTTPSLDGLAGDAIVFDHAFSTAPWTLPAHATLFTGTYHHEQSADWREPLDDVYPTLAEFFGSRGYLTGAFFANLYYGSPHFGLDRGFLHYEVDPLSLEALAENAWLIRRSRQELRELTGNRQLAIRKSAETMNADFLRWLDRQDADRPFLGFINYFDAHYPYLAPARHRFVTRDRPDQPPYWGVVPTRYDDAELDALRAEYDAAVAYVDAQVGALVADLERRGLLEHTVLLVIGDHGEEFAEHGVVGHGNSLYGPSVEVPLLLRLPDGEEGGRRVGDAVTIRDVPSTLASLAGYGAEHPFPGRPLTSHWDGSVEGPASPILTQVNHEAGRLGDWYPVHYGSLYALVEDGLYYILRGDGVEEVYSVDGDPWQERNLVGDPALAPRLPRLRAALSELNPASRSVEAPGHADAGTTPD